MQNKEFTPLEQAEQELPEPWCYRLFSGKTNKQFTALLALTMASTTVLSIKYFDRPLTHLVGGTIYFLSIIADNYSTNKALDAINIARENGVETPYGETCPGLKGITTAREFNRNIKLHVKDLVAMSVAVVLPPLGMTVGTAKGLAAGNNFFVAKLHRRATEIAKEKSPH